MRNFLVVVALAVGIATAASCGGSKGGTTTEGNRGGQGTSVAGIPTQGGQPETQTGPAGDTSGKTTGTATGAGY